MLTHNESVDDGLCVFAMWLSGLFISVMGTAVSSHGCLTILRENLGNADSSQKEKGKMMMGWGGFTVKTPNVIINNYCERGREKKTEKENSHETHHTIKLTQIVNWNTSGHPSTLHSYSFNVRTQTQIWQFEASLSPQQITNACTHTCAHTLSLSLKARKHSSLLSCIWLISLAGLLLRDILSQAYMHWGKSTMDISFQF